MNPILVFLLTVFLAALVNTPLRAAESDPQTHTNNGITYVLPAQKRSISEVTAKSYTFKGDTITIKWLEGALNVNGKNYGRVVSGDKVSVSASGGVTVNQKERKAE